MESLTCKACLSSDSSVTIVPDPLQDIFKRLIPEYEMQDVQMCLNCCNTLHLIKTFRDQCLTSLINLTKIKQEKEELFTIYTTPEVVIDDKPVIGIKNTRTRDILIYDETPVYICDICNGTFDTKTNLKTHMREHRRYPCKICPEIFTSCRQLKMHKDTHPPERKFMCEGCSKCFKGLKELRLHYERKHAVKQVSCTYPGCTKAFGSRSIMEDHIKTTHERPKTDPFICDFCGKALQHRQNLKYHIQTLHLNLKLRNKKECPFCGKWFRPSSHYKDHVKRHTGEKNFKCSICGRKYVTKSGLQRHSYSHTNTRPYNCKLCERGYYHISYLRDHYKRVHNSEMLGYIKK